MLALLFVMISSFSFAQIDKSYIDSSGQVEYSREVEKYSATIIVSEDLAYSSYNENITFDKIKYISTAEAFAEAIRRVYKNQSISSLYYK